VNSWNISVECKLALRSQCYIYIYMFFSIDLIENIFLKNDIMLLLKYIIVSFQLKQTFLEKHNSFYRIIVR